MYICCADEAVEIDISRTLQSALLDTRPPVSPPGEQGTVYQCKCWAVEAHVPRERDTFPTADGPDHMQRVLRFRMNGAEKEGR